MITAVVVSQAQVSTPVKWACIGNSITAGIFPNAAYAPKLAVLLGPSYTVENDGVSSMTLLKSGKVGAVTDAQGSGSYWTHGKLSNVFTLKPDIITIALGTNDAKMMNWVDSANFVRDYSALIDTLMTISSKPQIWLCLPCPCWVTDTSANQIRGSIIKNNIIPRIKQVATTKGVNTIDFYTPLANFQSHFPDNIHPDSIGGDSLAAILYRTYAAKAVRIACLGNSITQYGSSSDVPDIDAYPSKLGMLLGRGYLVQNDGVSGCAMQKKNAGWSYWDTGAKKFPLIFGLKPNVITIKLGTNDSRRYYWHTSNYIADYKAMVDTLNNNISPKPTIKLCLPIPAYPSGFVKYGINDTIITDSVIPAIKVVAQAKGLSIIDLNTPMQNTLGTLVPASDGVHPNAAGQDTLAHLIYRNFTSAAMALSATSIGFSASVGQKDTTGTKKTDTVLNIAVAGSLATVTTTHKSAWLTCTVDNAAQNAQKITNALSLANLPTTAGTYYDTVTVTATNANPASTRYVVTLNLTPGTEVNAILQPAASISPEIRLLKPGAISVTINNPGKNIVTMVAMTGQIAVARTFVGKGTYVVRPDMALSGVYIVRVTSGSQTMVRKIVVMAGE
jgi:lysophospholipase L1-like esterase